ncbi:MAG: ATP-binding protein [Desulfosudis oleivorans]|nr:ATP-binding protein [Desulfosudis oleivorans]
MLLNIVENGIKYSHVGGKVSVSSYVNDGYAWIDVKDDGIGISEEDIKYVFDRFYRADRSRKRESGSGLGLSISRWIAGAYKEALRLKANPPREACFTIKLPI